MAIAVDASTPVRWSNTLGSAETGGSITSASFTAPSGALLVLAAQYDTTTSWASGSRTASDSGGLTWTPGPERLGNESTAGGGSGIWWATTVSAVARTVTFALGAATGGASPWGTTRTSCKLYVLTGVDVGGTPVMAFGANNEGGTNTDPMNTTSLTPDANGVMVVSACDWNVTGLATSSNLTLASGPDTATYASAISVFSGLQACSNGVGLTGNINAAGAGPQWKWTQIIVREAAAAQDTPELYGRPDGLRGMRQLAQLLAG